jgi:hypothetical protein
MLKKLSALFLLPLLLAGCDTPFNMTNVTASQQTRTTNNLYTVEVAVASRQQTLRWSSIRPQIMVDHQTYPMRPVMLMSNRWEGQVPAPAGVNEVRYQYRFDFDYNAFGQPQADSVISPEYTLHILNTPHTAE